MKPILVGAVAVSIAVVPTLGTAGPAPTALLGKSVIVTWGEERIQRIVGESSFRSVRASHNLSIYISSAGRVFSRQTITIGSRSGSGYQIAGEEAARPIEGRVPRFSGQTMTFFAPMQSAGIRRQIIEFHGNFTSCIATISFAKEPGRPTAITRSIIDKRMVEIQSITASNANCSVQNGNVFGGGA